MFLINYFLNVRTIVINKKMLYNTFAGVIPVYIFYVNSVLLSEKRQID